MILDTSALVAILEPLLFKGNDFAHTDVEPVA
jgi:uncharacterized protein with PIN domain